MKKSAYIAPQQETLLFVSRTYVCGDDSLPFGGDDGPGVVETKQREDELEEPTPWGSLW